MPTIIATRHPEDVLGANNILNGRRNSKLTRKGEIQTKELIKQFQREHPEVRAIFTSPLDQAKIPAIECSKLLGVRYITNEGLTERNCRVCKEKHYDELPKFARKTVKVGDHLYVVEADSYEGDEALRKRAMQVLFEMISYTMAIGLEDKDKLAVFSHGAILTAMKLVVKGLPYTEFHTMGKVPNAEPFELMSWKTEQVVHTIKSLKIAS